MDKQNVILKTHELEVIGQGGMIYEPCQIGEWWMMPADKYTGTIPHDIQAKWDRFKQEHPEVIGYLIADDMREELERRERKAVVARARALELENRMKAMERKRRQEAFERRVKEIAVAGEKALVGGGKVLIMAAKVTGKVIVAVVKVAGPVLLGVVGLVAMLAVGVITTTATVAGTALMFDPMIVAVMPDGRYVCVAAWWN
jgi:flagellar biosynthesis protein FliQ